ncbi:MAG: PIN domain-containing protein [Melioribacteraceae bacterium]|jgi:predicted nucleic-acid-binding protein|nr:PIN domain-containing protein [Melioribacteraceae bacterium]
MRIIDANIILRYLLKDNLSLHKKAVEIIKGYDLFLPNEIVAEIVYVLEKVYHIPKSEICNVLSLLFERNNFSFVDKDIILISLQYYLEFNLDFADALLISYSKVKKADVLTFDKKLNKIIEKI